MNDTNTEKLNRSAGNNSGGRNINLNYLQYFYVVTESENMTKAASKLYITQPALSNAISKLENELGVKLFDRVGNNKIKLNDLGRILKEHLRFVFQELDDAMEEIDEKSNDNYGSITFAAPSGGITDLTIREFRQIYPHVRIYQHFMSAKYIQQGLLDRTLDFAISYVPFSNSMLEWQHFNTVRLMALVAEGHPLACRESIRLHELATERFAFNSFNAEFPAICASCCQKAGFEADVVYQSGTPEIVSELVQAGECVTLIPTLGYDHFNKDHVSVSFRNNHIVPLRLNDPFCEMSVGIVTLKNHFISRSAKAFIRFLTENF